MNEQTNEWRKEEEKVKFEIYPIFFSTTLPVYIFKSTEWKCYLYVRMYFSDEHFCTSWSFVILFFFYFLYVFLLYSFKLVKDLKKKVFTYTSAA